MILSTETTGTEILPCGAGVPIDADDLITTVRGPVFSGSSTGWALLST